jgi:hypothetical protein
MKPGIALWQAVSTIKLNGAIVQNVKNDAGGRLAQGSLTHLGVASPSFELGLN